MIKHLVFDVDNTLLDFNMSLFRAEKAVADRFGIQFTADYYTNAAEMIDAAWGEYQMSNTSDPELQNAWHDRYREFLRHHYDALSERYGIACDTDDLLKTHFMDCPAGGDLMRGGGGARFPAWGFGRRQL